MVMAAETVPRALPTGSRVRDRRRTNKFAMPPITPASRKLIGVKGTHYLHRRMREACAADGLTSAELISSLLDMRERAIARGITY